MKPLISVIVPVYNTANVLKKTINSLLAQSYPNIEIILVDDGSSDDSGRICDRYSLDYENIIVVHKKNGGLSSARNMGLQKARGELIGFVDSDDYIDSEMYNYLFELIKKYNADIASVAIKETEEYGIKAEQPKEKVIVKKGSEILRYYMKITTIKSGYSVCRCLFHSYTLEGLLFRDGKKYEDIDFKFKALEHANCFVDSNMQYYYYVQSGKSLSFGPYKHSDMDLKTSADVLFELCKEKKDKVLVRYARIKQARTPMSLLIRIAYAGFDDEQFDFENKREVIEKLTKELRENIWILLNSPIPFSRKIASLLLSVDFKLFYYPLKVYKSIKNNLLYKI